MRSSAFGLLLFVALVLASGCAPDPVYRLSADLTGDAREEWFQGHYYVTRTSDGVEATLAYERTVDQRHVFQAEVANRSGSAVTVDPALFLSLPGSALPDSGLTAFASASARDTLLAVDPEREILDIDLEHEREEARERTSAVFALAAVAADAVGDVADLASGGRTPEAQAADALKDAERHARFQARRVAHQQDLNSLSDRRAYWAETALRRTTLPPGTEVRGRVFFPVSKEARYVTVAMPVGDTQTRFFYWQYRVEP